MWINFSTKKRNDAGNAQTEMAVAAPRGLGAGRENISDRRGADDFFRQRAWQPNSPALSRKAPCGRHGRPGRTAAPLGSIALAARPAAEPGESLPRAPPP